MAALLLTIALQAAAGDAAGDLRISLEEFRALHEKGEILVIDVRDEAAYEAGHIPGAVWIPADSIEARAGELKTERRPIVAYCS